MSEKTYLVRRSNSSERKYRLYELTWLWRTAELPHDAEFLNEDGLWRPVSELVEPILEAQRTREPPPGPPARPPLSTKWWSGIAVCVCLVVAGAVGPRLARQYFSWQAAKAQAREALEREQAGRKQDFISTNLIVPGMTREDVRRVVGPPRSIKATADRQLERWIYRSQIVVFEDGKVTGFEAMK